MQSRAPIEPRHHAGGRLYKTDQGGTYMGLMVTKGGTVSGKPKAGNSGPTGWKLHRSVDHVRRNAQKAVDWPTRRKMIAARKEAQAAVRRKRAKAQRKGGRGQ